MRPDSLFQKEIITDLRDRRGLFFKFALPAALLLPLIFADLPVSLPATGITVAVIFSGVFGSSIGLVRLRENGMLERMAMLPISPRRLTAGYILANTLLDGAQIAVPLAAFLFVHLPATPEVAVSFVSAVVAANALGVIVAAVPGSSGEGHLYAIVTVMAAIAISGLVAPTPHAQGLLPFWYLYATLLAIPGTFPLSPVALAGLILGSALVISPRLFGRSVGSGR
ncbi:MAG: hypothetical protein ACOX8D_02485 [Methanoculleus sp.]